jgi:hypothetical protein
VKNGLLALGIKYKRFFNHMYCQLGAFFAGLDKEKMKKVFLKNKRLQNFSAIIFP